ncbi:MAG: hypothetical protein HN348_33925, partial [Proteobacteria bacterium]|nr:hypothetical protein [Pseudomonadota bacterium]
MPLKLLATADIHIGRRPTRLPTTEDARRCSAAAMWDTIVQTAITQKIDALILAGDIVESDNQYYEALGRLETGLKRLSEQGIHTYAVSGNHDFEVFPRIIESLDDDHFHLVGQGGSWESVQHLHEGEPALQIHGWSFPSRYVECSPMDSYTLPRDTSLPTLGILHGDVDVSNSRYAPISTRQLEETDTDLWIMGHVHDAKPMGQNKALYTGSPQALDPGEQGNHGPWLLHIGDDQKITREQLVLSRVHYDTVTVSLDGVDTLDEFDRALGEKTVSAVKDFATQPSPPEFAILRVVLDGATRTQAFRKLGYPSIVVQVVSPQDGNLELRAWHHAVTGIESETLMECLSKNDSYYLKEVDPGDMQQQLDLGDAVAAVDIPDGDNYLVCPRE